MMEEQLDMLWHDKQNGGGMMIQNLMRFTVTAQ